jgi:hypothetical protein
MKDDMRIKGVSEMKSGIYLFIFTEPENKPEEVPVETEVVKELNKCINISCKSSFNASFSLADAATITYYDAAKKRKPMVCEECADNVVIRTLVSYKKLSVCLYCR